MPSFLPAIRNACVRRGRPGRPWIVAERPPGVFAGLTRALGARLAVVKPLRVALAQIAPDLGRVDENLVRHRALIDEAREAGAKLVVFPELGLTGYVLQDLSAEIAMRLDDRRLAELAAATSGMSAVVSFVEESGDHRLYIAAALLEDGEIRHVHRKLFLPTYGLFDERRFFGAGELLRAVPSRLGP